MKKFYFFAAFFLVSVNAQVVQNPFTSDFIISQENIPSTFIQKDIKLFPNQNGYLAVWEDYRHGEPKYFAQRFDNMNQPIGQNLEHFSNQFISFANNGSHLAVHKSYVTYDNPYMDDTYYYLTGKIYNPDFSATNSFYVDGGVVSWCGTGSRGYYHDLTSNSNSYIYSTSRSGSILIKRFNLSGSLLFNSDTAGIELPLTSYSISSSSNQLDEYVLFWEHYSDSTFYPPDTLPSGIYAIFFTPNDSIYKNNIFIKSLPYGYHSPIEKSDIKAITLKDTCYQLFSFGSDSLYLSTIRIDRTGNIVGGEVKIPLNYPSTSLGGDIPLYNFSFSKIKDGYFYLLVTLYYHQNSLLHYTTLLKFDEYGNLIGTPVYSSTFSTRIGDHFVSKGNNRFIIPVSKENDVFKSEIENFSIINEQKINDDIIGSNETIPSPSANSTKMFVNWKDEKFSWGRFINEDGIPSGNKNEIDGFSAGLLHSGNILSLWKKPDTPTDYKIGFNLYDSSFNLILSRYLASAEQWKLFITAKLLKDSSYVIFYRKNSSYFLKRFSQNGELLGESEVTGLNNTVFVGVYEDELNEFWISNGNQLQKYSAQLTPLTQVYNRNSSLYIGNNNTVYVSLQYGKLYAYISSIDGTFQDTVTVAQNVTEYSLGRLEPDRFLIIYKTQNKLYASAYTNTGQKIKNPVLIHSDVASFKKNPSFTIFKDKILFTWCDTRIVETGYTVYGRFVDADVFMKTGESENNTIPERFELLQNYPNPFNPVTTINFSIPTSPQTPLLSKERGRGEVVTLKVYDMLGREVAVLVNEAKEPGTYEVKYDASKLSSGVYIYRLTTQGFTASRKMMVVK